MMKENEQEYVEKLESVIKQMIAPLKNIPLKLVLESISGKKVIPFDKDNLLHSELLEKLKKVSELACLRINEAGGILSQRVNEVGNKVELPIKNALREIGFTDADVPVNKKGIKQSTGYPDLGFSFKDFYVYIECKTYNKNNIGTTRRSFYLSPTEGFKVTREAIHLVLSLEMEQKSAGVFVATAWKIVQIEKIDVDVKREFNSDNKRIYSAENILAGGKC